MSHMFVLNHDSDELDDLGVAFPFDDTPIDWDVDTGSDWYMKALSASMGGRIMNGLNHAASCETLAKVSEAAADGKSHGRIKWAPQEAKIPTVSGDIDDLAYTGNMYHGMTSVSNTVLAFDSTDWEPSKKARTRETAVLAALIDAENANPEDAAKIASMISADNVPVSAINAVKVPVAALKRDVVSVSKTNHTIFTSGNCQRAIRWEDEKLTREMISDHAAVDWQRVTNIARYIGEVNSKYDPNFRNYATARGVPYQLIRGAWAYASHTDMAMDSKMFKDIPKVKISNFMIPAIAQEYGTVVDDLFSRASNLLAHTDPELRDAQTSRLISIIDNMRTKRPTKHITISQGTDSLDQTTSHRLNPTSAALEVKNSSVAFDCLVESCASGWTGHMKSMQESITRDKLAGMIDTQEDRESKLAKTLEPSTLWVIAANICTTRLGSTDVGWKRVATLKHDMFKTSAPIEQACSVNAINQQSVVQYIRRICHVIGIGIKRQPPPMNFSLTRAQIEGRHAMANFTKRAKTYLDRMRTYWADRYEARSKILLTKHPDKAIMYSGASVAFRNITLGALGRFDARYIDAMSENTNYLLRMAKNYVRKRKLDLPKIDISDSTTAKHYAAELDRALSPKYTWAGVEEFVYGKLSMLAADFGLDQDPNEALLDPPDEVKLETDPDVVDPVVESKIEKKDDDFTAGMSDADRAAYEFIMAMANRPASVRVITETVVLATYESPAIAEAHAVANGYATFALAYADLGERARFDELSSYTQKGAAAHRVPYVDSDDDDVL